MSGHVLAGEVDAEAALHGRQHLGPGPTRQHPLDEIECGQVVLDQQNPEDASRPGRSARVGPPVASHGRCRPVVGGIVGLDRIDGIDGIHDVDDIRGDAAGSTSASAELALVPGPRRARHLGDLERRRFTLRGFECAGVCAHTRACGHTRACVRARARARDVARATTGPICDGGRGGHRLGSSTTKVLPTPGHRVD